MCHILKLEKAKLEVEIDRLRVHRVARPTVVALPTRKTDPWAAPGTKAYKTFAHFCQAQSPQKLVRIPIDATSRRIEQVLHCPRPACRYVAKAKTELDRHRSHAHPTIPAPSAPPIVPAAAAPGLAAYTVKGLPPVLPPRRAGKKRSAGAAAEGEASAEGEALEDCMDLDGAEPESMERKPIVGRVAVNPRTGHELQALMPTSCVAAYIAIHEDLFIHRRYLATYNHKSPAAQMEIPPEKIDSLPPHLRGMTKTSTWGDAADDVKQEHCEAVLRWAWAKHIHFFGGERPGDTVLVEGKLSLEPAV